MTVGREPGDSTMIRVSWETKEELDALKKVTGLKVEAVGDVVKRILHENRVLRTKKVNDPMPNYSESELIKFDHVDMPNNQNGEMPK